MTILKKLFKKRKAMSDETKDTVADVVENVTDTVKVFSKQEQGTRRLLADTAAESWLTRNIRPIAMIWVMVMITLYLVLKAVNVDVPREVSDTVYWLGMMAFGFYFPGRTFDKWVKSKFK